MLKNFQPTRKGKAPVNDIEIYFEAFGEPSNPALVFVCGLDQQSVLFSDEIIQPFVEARLYVIKFDNRDTGHSTWMNSSWHKSKPYTLEDMATDAVGLLDYLNIQKAHFIGVSMGGMIAQRIAISHADRVLTLMSLISSGYAMNIKGAKSFLFKATAFLTPFLIKRQFVKNRFMSRKITVESYVKIYGFLNGKKHPYDEERFRMLFTEAIEKRHGQNPNALYHQFFAIVASGSRLEEMHKIKAPTLVIHGTNDPLVHVNHAKIYAPLIPRSRLVLIDGMGHGLPKTVMPQIVSEVLSHVRQKL